MYNRWAHYTAVWDKTNAIATLYFNGKKVLTEEFHGNSTTTVPTTLPPTFDVGNLNITVLQRISISHVYLFDQPLTDEAVTRVRGEPIKTLTNIE